MNKDFVYKNREEMLLMKELSSSGMISFEELIEIKKYYNEKVPYHNFLHVLKVAIWILELSSERFNIIEIRSLFMAALFHDAWHTWTAQSLDEFRSLDLAFENLVEFEKKYNYEWIDYSIVRNAIMWTVFKNRGKNKNEYAKILADFDVSTIWMDFSEFLYYSDFPISIEFWVEIEKWLSDVNYFKFLMWVDKNIFRCKEVSDIFPNWLKNIEKYLKMDKQKVAEIFYFWKDKDLTYKEFKEKFFY